ncbi:MAG: hypothetical protein H0X34_17375 [Chthoniobacterales bacterium]|nr:hypothetical protein [Chthoniobacterales bacterium]
MIFKLDGKVIRTENKEPYAVAGDINGVYTAWKPAVGNHVLVATPYSADAGKGTVGAPVTISFSVNSGNTSSLDQETVHSKSLLNVSTRVKVQSGDSILIGGFIVTGDKSKLVALRGIGPSLAATGVQGVLTDPVLELYNSAGELVDRNDDWTSLPSESITEGLAPTNPAESLIEATLSPGSYTAVLRGANGATGVGLFELYDIDATNSRVSNISTRGVVEAGDGAMIAGFIIGGADATKVMVRAIGPSLSASGVAGALLDPTLELHDAEGSLIFSNDNWHSDQEKDIIASTIPPTSDKEAAIVATLTPGNYTATVRGVGNTTGVALVEVYNLDTP